MYKIVIEIDPVPASRPRVGKFGVFYSATYTQFMNDMMWHKRSIKKLLLSEPLRADITFWKKISASQSKKMTDQMHNTYCVSNVDLDNLEKAIYDSLNGHLYLDDKQIVEHSTRKKWTKDKAKIEITLQIINQ